MQGSVTYSIRFRRRTLRVLGLLAAGYLNLIIAPCASAAPQPAHHGPGPACICPDTALDDTCQHAADGVCAPDQDLLIDGKRDNGKKDLKYGLLFLAPAVTPMSVPWRAHCLSPDAGSELSESVSLQIRYCVFRK